MEKLTIIGAGGHAQQIASAAELIACWGVIEFVDDAFTKERKIHNWSVVSTISDYIDSAEDGSKFIVGIGDNTTRVELQLKLTGRNLTPVTVIHPSAVVNPYSTIGQGSFISTQAVISMNAAIGDVCIVNSGAVVGHDSTLMDGVHISTNVALGGGVTVGQNSLLGLSVAVGPGLSIGANVIAGIGAAVVRDVPDGATVKGVPARE